MNAIIETNEYYVLDSTIYIYKSRIDALILLVIDRRNELRVILNKLFSIVTDLLESIRNLSIFTDSQCKIQEKIDRIKSTAMFDERLMWKNIRSGITLAVNTIYMEDSEMGIGLVATSILFVKTIKTRFRHLCAEDMNKIYNSYTPYKTLILE